MVQRGVFRPRCFPATSGRGAGDSQTCPNFRLWQMAITYRMLVHGASDLDQRCLKMRNSESGCTFPPNIFAPTPKITPKSQRLWTYGLTALYKSDYYYYYYFGGPFNAKPIIQRALRKSHGNGATKLKLYSYISIGKYLGVCQNFSARGTCGGAKPRRAP